MIQRGHDMPFGAAPQEDGRWRFRLWAPGAARVDLILDGADGRPMRAANGWFEAVLPARAGMTYGYRIDDDLFVPDPASRMQAEDVHGASVLLDPRAYAWSDDDWQGRPWEEAVFYELHVGAFTEEGSFAAVVPRLDELAALGVTAIELMPVADFPGARDWGYDGVLLFAPDRRYGTPDDLKRLIEAAHALGLMVFLDVVYNHFGPEGNYLHVYAPPFFTRRHRTPWGAAINFDGGQSRTVREFFVHNALYWLEEYHLDGLRLDAVHAIADDSRPDIVEELGQRVTAACGKRRVHLVLENDRNTARYLDRYNGEPRYRAQWNDDFHHAMHVLLTGEEDGYYADFARAPLEQLARVLAEGFAFQGEYSAYHRTHRGEPSAHLPVTAFVGFLQNHDQIGNRACGERMTSLARPEALRAATALWLLAPHVPLMFMGQEWGTRRPFPFFCDFGPDLAPKVREGRRAEFAHFAGFSDPHRRERIPDPGEPGTFLLAKLDWSERDTARGRAWLDLHRALLEARRRIVPRLAGSTGKEARCVTFSERAIAARWMLADGAALVLAANLGEEPVADVALPEAPPLFATPDAHGDNGTLMPWSVVWVLCTPAQAEVRVNGLSVFD
ncbi:MAG: malto-oligosyltrehalose trehalohydrolase [Thiohalomonadaceae bacterium]